MTEFMRTIFEYFKGKDITLPKRKKSFAFFYLPDLPLNWSGMTFFCASALVNLMK